MQEVLLYYEKQTVPWFSVALVMKNKTPFDMLLYDIIATAGNDKYDIKSFCFRIKKIKKRGIYHVENFYYFINLYINVILHKRVGC